MAVWSFTRARVCRDLGAPRGTVYSTGRGTKGERSSSHKAIEARAPIVIVFSRVRSLFIHCVW